MFLKPGLHEVSISEIKTGDRFRKELGDIDSLVESIKDKGLIQPITIASDLTLIAGERRLQASRIVGLKVIPCLVRTIKGELDLREIELLENIERKDLTWQERDRLTKRIFDLKKSTDETWNVRKQEQLTDESKSLIHRRIQLAEALDIIPDLANCRTEDEAFKRLKRIEHDVAFSELETKARSRMQGAAKFAKDHYRIGNALEGLTKLNPGTFHFAEVDPPYAIDLKKAKGKETTTGRYQEIEAKDYPAFIEKVAKGVFKALYKDSYCLWWFGCEWYQIVREILEEAGFSVSSVPAIWVKHRGASSQPESSLASAYEPFFVIRKGQPKLRKMGRSNVFDFPPLSPAVKIHPTEKPLDLMLELLETFAYPSASVLVPFLGSGVTLRACYKSNMIGFGWDLDEMTKNRFLTRVKQDALDEKESTED